MKRCSAEGRVTRARAVVPTHAHEVAGLRQSVASHPC